MAINKSFLLNNGAQFGTALHVRGQYPLDDRFLRENFAAIKNPVSWNEEEGNYKGSYSEVSNFVGTPVKDDVYYNTTNKKFYKYSGSSWAEQTPKYFVHVGMHAFDVANKREYVYVAPSVSTENIVLDASWALVPTMSDVTSATEVIGVVADASELVRTPQELKSIYFNTTTRKWYIYTDGGWQDCTNNTLNYAEQAGEADTATSLKTARTINGLSFDGTQNISNFFESDATASTTSKVSSLGGVSLEAGTVIRVKFQNENTAANPTIVNIPLKRGNEVFDKWEAGVVVSFTLVGTSPNQSWQADAEARQNIINRNFSTSDFTLFDFINTKSDVVEESATPLPISALSGEAAVEKQNTVFEALYSLAGNNDNKLHFILFKGNRCKFDIDSYSDIDGVKTVKFSFIYKSNVNSAIVNLITIEMSRSTNNGYMFSYLYTSTDLLGTKINTASFATKTSVDTLTSRVASIESNMHWFEL